MTTHKDIGGPDTEQLLGEWRVMHPELTEDEFDEALIELRSYLRLAWMVYRELHPELNLPESI